MDDLHNSRSDVPGPESAAARRRRSGFLNHLIAYFGVMILLVPLNFLLAPDHPWFVYPLVLWMGPLALHAAHAMGLFNPRRGR